MSLELDGKSLTLSRLWRIMEQPEEKVVLPCDARQNIEESRKRVEKVLQSDAAIYGINTGFGSLATTAVPKSSLADLQENLIRSHSTGWGEALSADLVRGVLALRINSLAQGFSGVRLSTVDLMLSCLNQGLLPRIPAVGSLGASGDLAPLSHMVLALMGEGEFLHHSDPLKALASAGLGPLKLEAKEGLGLINGTPVMTAISARALRIGARLMQASNAVGALSLEALQGSRQAFRKELHTIRPHQGQIACAQRLWDLLEDSENMSSHKDCGKVQDAYSLRCMPQVHGACLDALRRAEETINIEMNSVTDNPIVLEEDIVSGGNFHGEPVGLVMAYASCALTELMSISERRQNRLVHPGLSGLPAFLTAQPGLNSGLMIVHYTSAACLTEAKVLSHPSVVDSIPTSGDQEDHVSMGTTQSRQALKIAELGLRVLASELLMATTALRLVKRPAIAPRLQPLLDAVASRVPEPGRDRNPQSDLAACEAIIMSDLISGL